MPLDFPKMTIFQVSVYIFFKFMHRKQTTNIENDKMIHHTISNVMWCFICSMV